MDNNRNNTVGTLFDGYIGASYSCTSDTYTGPAEASEPEIKNELWVADTFTNIKFSNNIHSFGGYFMWAPGTYLPNRDEGVAVHANIGIEKYFFEAGDRILNRIKTVRGTVILPERTGPIADVLYSAAGNSADEHWYNRGVIAYSFETGADRFGGLEQTTVSVASAAGANRRSLWQPEPVHAAREGDLRSGPGDGGDADRAFRRRGEPRQSRAEHHIHGARRVRARGRGGHAGAGISALPVGFQPRTTRRASSRRSSSRAGNFGLLESALAYAKDDD